MSSLGDNNFTDVPRDEAESDGGGYQPPNPKGKSCKGCAYYSSDHKAKSENPTCVGFWKTLPEVPYVVRETELDASKKGLTTLTNFKYACIGYSVYLDNKDSSADSKDKLTKLPICTGLEVVVVAVEKSSTLPVGHVPAHTHKTEDVTLPEHEHATPQPRSYSYRSYYRRYKPRGTTPEESLNRQADDILHGRPK